MLGGGGRRQGKENAVRGRQSMRVIHNFLWQVLIFQGSVSVQSIRQGAMLKVDSKCFHRITIQSIKEFTHSLRSTS